MDEEKIQAIKQYEDKLFDKAKHTKKLMEACEDPELWLQLNGAYSNELRAWNSVRNVVLYLENRKTKEDLMEE